MNFSLPLYEELQVDVPGLALSWCWASVARVGGWRGEEAEGRVWLEALQAPSVLLPLPRLSTGPPRWSPLSSARPLMLEKQSAMFGRQPYSMQHRTGFWMLTTLVNYIRWRQCHSETDSDEQMLLTVDLFLVLSLDVQIQRSLSAGKQIRNVTDNIESLHSSKQLHFFLIIISTLIILC